MRPVVQNVASARERPVFPPAGDTFATHNVEIKRFNGSSTCRLGPQKLSPDLGSLSGSRPGVSRCGRRARQAVRYRCAVASSAGRIVKAGSTCGARHKPAGPPPPGGPANIACWRVRARVAVVVWRECSPTLDNVRPSEPVPDLFRRSCRRAGAERGRCIP